MEQVHWKKKYYKYIYRIFCNATRQLHVEESSDQTSNRNVVMNFYRLLLGLFKDFLLWFLNTMAAVWLCVHEKTRGAH